MKMMNDALIYDIVTTDLSMFPSQQLLLTWVGKSRLELRKLLEATL